jgi:hypothetical protein
MAAVNSSGIFVTIRVHDVIFKKMAVVVAAAADNLT